MSEVSEELETDEPQFKVKKSDSKGIGSTKTLMILTMLVVLCVALVAGYDDIISFLKKDKPEIATAEYSTKTAEIKTFKLGRVSERKSIDVKQDESINGQENLVSGDVPLTRADSIISADVNVTILDKLESIEERLVNINRDMMLMRDGLGNDIALNKELISGMEDGVGEIYQSLLSIEKDGSKRHTFIRNAFSKFNNFSSQVKTRNEEFDFEILHAESWAGKKRLIGYEKSTPNQVKKIYVGDRVGRWLLSDISNSNAVFKFDDGTLKEVVLP